MSPSEPPPEPSIMPPASSARGLLQATVNYLEARGQLLQIEAKEAASTLSRSGRAWLIAAAAFVIGACTLIPAAISLSARLLRIPWEYLALGIAGFLFVIGMIFLSVALRRSRGLRPFEESINQFREDRAWLAKNHPQK